MAEAQGQISADSIPGMRAMLYVPQKLTMAFPAALDELCSPSD